MSDTIKRLQLLDRKETSALLRVTIRTLERLEDRGELEPVRVGKCVRYRATDIERLCGIRAQRTGAR